MFIKAETMENLNRISERKKHSHSIFDKLSSHRRQKYANSLVPPRGSVYCMLNRKVNTKGKIVK